MSSTQFVDGVRAFADFYQGFIIDQWGVLHNGSEPYPNVMQTLKELKQRNKRLVLLTNSGRRTDYNRDRMAELGFDLAHFDGIVTSGEATWLAIQQRTFEPFSSLGRHCLLFTRQGDYGPVDGLDLNLVETAEEADFIYLTWLDGRTHSLDDFRATLEIAYRRGLPLICANPDKVAVNAEGLHTAPGALADLYEELGGKVVYVGKPHQPIYKACLEALSDLDPGEIIGIGDSMEHDIKGATDAGVSTAFVLDGIHVDLFRDERTKARELDALALKYDARADYAIWNFTW